MKKYINTSNYYLSTITSVIPNTWTNWTFDVSDVTVDWVTLPTDGYYWVDVDFWDTSKREIFRIISRTWYTLTYDARISPYGKKVHSVWATVWLRDFSQLLNSLSTNTDNFWEIEIVWEANELNILVRWGNVFLSWKTNEYTTVNNTAIHLDISSEVYIVLKYRYDEELNLRVYSIEAVSELSDTGMYLLWKVTTNATTITSIEDLRGTMVWWGWEWDMKWAEWKAKYDTNNREADVYEMDNMVQWNEKLYIIPSEHAKYEWYQTTKQDTLVSWINIHTINNQSILWPGNFSLDTILTVGWETVPTADWATTFVFWVDSEHLPLTDDAFLVFTDSGTMLIKDWDNPNDYSYNSETHTITFNNELYPDEHAIVWIMYNNSSEQAQIGTANLILKYWENTASFNANQIWDDVTVDLETDLWIWDIAHDSTITIKQWWITDQSFTTNQSNDKDIKLSWLIPMTQEEYNDEPDTKLTDNNWYFIVEEN